MRSALVRSALTALVLGSTVAAAADDTAAAKALVKEARLAFDTGDFQTALQKYEAAFKLKPVPALQFNLGQCHRQLGHTERALYFFRRFLDSSPPEEQAAQVRPLVDELQAKLTKAERQRVEKEEYERRLELERVKAVAADAQAQAAAKAAEEAQRKAELELALKFQPPPPEPPAYKKAWFWIAVGGAVAVAAGVGAGVYLGTAPKPLQTTWPDINAR
jgi:tetratricopeptide (TPR) repeat protein